MPYKSRAQAAYIHINHPTIAKRWDMEYSIPEGDKKAKLKAAVPRPAVTRPGAIETPKPKAQPTGKIPEKRAPVAKTNPNRNIGTPRANFFAGKLQQRSNSRSSFNPSQQTPEEETDPRLKRKRAALRRLRANRGEPTD